MGDARTRPDLLHRRFARLRLVAARLATSTVPADGFFDPDDFMLVSWSVADRPPGIELFAHVDTRRRLALDADGTGYRLDADARWVRHTTLRAAIDALGLWELPWLRPDLAVHRRGRDWEHRWELYAELTGDLDRAS